MADLALYRYKTACMQRIQNLVVKGYTRYTSGVVHHTKALKLVAKFEEHYGTHLNENQRVYRKKKGLANTKLIMYPKPNSNEFLWWLLATEGKGTVETFETLKGVTDSKSRLQWFDDYEMVKMLREGRAKPNITWRMTKQCYSAWNTRIRHAVRSRSEMNLKQTTWSLHRVPGFSELRIQVKQLRAVVLKEWERIRSNDGSLPVMPKSVTYVTNADTSTVPLSQIVRRIQMGLRPFPRQENAKVLIEE